jgi:type I restriction enzyme R subunit
VVPLLYEGRYVHQHVDQIPIDEWFKKYTAGLTEEQRADLKRKYSSADQLNRTEQKVRAIAWDVSEHFQTNFKGTGFKGQLVTPSKATALLYKRFLDEFGMVTSEVLISPPDMGEGEEDVMSARGTVADFWEHMMKRYGNESRYQRDLTSRFRSAEAPEIIIVVDKLLTGFDAPRNAVLYLTRSLKDHKLLQAVARVNRVSDGKDVGLIVDYYGILQHLEEALDEYMDAVGDFQAHLQEVLQPLEGAVRELPQRHADLWDVFKTVAHKDDQEAVEQYLGAEVERQRFYERLTAYAKTLRLALACVTFHENTDPDLIARYRRDLKYFMQLRASVARRYAETVDFKQYQGPIQKLLDTYVGAGEVETLVEPVSILDKDAFAEEVAAVENPHAKAEMIANRVRRAIHEHVDEDPVFYKRFSELIDKTLADAKAERISQLELLAAMEDIRDRVRDRRAYEDVPQILKNRDVAKSYYDVLRDQFGVAGLSVPEAEAATLAAVVDDIITVKRKVDWANDIDVQNQMKIAIEDELFAFKKASGVQLDFDTIDRLLDRIIDVARRRVP